MAVCSWWHVFHPGREGRVLVSGVCTRGDAGQSHALDPPVETLQVRLLPLPGLLALPPGRPSVNHSLPPRACHPGTLRRASSFAAQS